MGIINSETNLKEVSKDNNLRCDPIHVTNIQLSDSKKPNKSLFGKFIFDIVEGINNGVNYSADNYSIEPSKNIYISVKEFDKGIPLIFKEDCTFLESITFLKSDVETINQEQFLNGLIKENEIIFARSGAVGKVAWFGELINNFDDYNFIASGFTTRARIKESCDLRFVSIWLNLPFVKYYLLAKSSGKCQRNIAQEYLYNIPFPDIEYKKQKKIADIYFPKIIGLETSLLKLPKKGEIVDSILSEILKIDLLFSSKSGFLASEDNLLNISNRYSLRCDAKQEQKYFRSVIDVFSKIKYKKMNDYFSGAFYKGKQPKYLHDQEKEGIPIISTLTIQDLSLIRENCKKVSLDSFKNILKEERPQKGDILLTLDGAVSVGKPVFFDSEEEYGIDSHIGIIRLDNIKEAKLISHLLGSEICQAQFRLHESGATSHSINEVDLRKIIIPELNQEEKKVFNKLFNSKAKRIKKELNNAEKTRDTIYNSFVKDLLKVT